MSDNVKSGAPRVGLYLVCESAEVEALIAPLRQVFLVFNRSEYEKNMHVVEVVLSAQDDKNVAGAGVLVELAKANGVVALVRDDYALAAAVGADGVMLSRIEDMDSAREAVGTDGIVGLRCGNDKAVAARAVDAGADAAGFDRDPLKMAGWWSGMSEKPCLVEAIINNDNCGAYVRAGATFLNATAYIFGHDKGVMQAAVNMLFAMEEAQKTSLN